MARLSELHEECIQISSGAADKSSVLAQIAKLAKRAEALSGYTEKDVYEAFTEREAQSSTGLERGIAIPHCRLDRVSEFVVGVLVLKAGVDFGAIDGAPSRGFIFVIGPTAERNVHIRILSAISRGLTQSGATDSLLSASEPADVVRLFGDRIDMPRAERPQEQSMVTVFVQSRAAHDAVRELFTGPVYGNGMVLDAVNLGRDLHALPLFTAFWTDGPEDYAKIIIAVVPRAMTNEIVRKINVTCGEDSAGVMVTVQDLALVSGSLAL